MTEDATPLPIESIRGGFDAALRRGNVVVAAATGSGKSTRLPVWATTQGPVLVVEPRRLAATALAGFVADSLGTAIGGEVGHAVRFDSRYGETTRIVFVTPGIALRWYAEGRMDRFSTVVLDEFHERRWDTDLLLAMLRGDTRHRLVLTSATMDGQRLAEYVGAEYLEAGGRSFPVDVRYLASGPRDMPSSRDLPGRVRQAVARAMEETPGDVLVFLPGRREIREAAAAVGGSQAEIIELHGSAALETQRRAMNTVEGRRVILATNVAETSLTVPGVTAVVDSGLERRTRRRNGRTVLALDAVATTSAEQRRGRAGRTAPGVCYRLWARHAPLARTRPPEVLREDLTDMVLAAAAANRPVRRLHLPDPPPEEALAAAEDTLHRCGALDASGNATRQGYSLFDLPVDSWLAHLIVAMPDDVAAGFMVDLAASLNAGRRWARPVGDSREREELLRWLGRPCDATLQVAALRCDTVPGVSVDDRGRQEARRLAGQLRERLGLPPVPTVVDEDANAVMSAAVQAMPELAFVRRDRRRHAMGNGADEVLVDESSLFGTENEAALVLDDHSVPGRGKRDNRTVATCLAPVSLEVLAHSDRASTEIDAARWDGEKLVARRRWLYAGRTISEEEVQPRGEAARQAAASLVLEGRLLKPAGARLREDIDAWSLYVKLGNAEGAIPDAETWLQERFRELGVEDGEDLVLVEADDLRFDGVPEWERERFDEKYPRAVSLTDLHMRAHYDVRRKIVTVEKIGGKRHRDPQRWELPAWPGWRVKFQRASRVVDVR
ncbi:MAG: helicase-related protein [Ectothiorhodospiraceae bacterium]|jgi:HrpA-like RNA helicase